MFLDYRQKGQYQNYFGQVFLVRRPIEATLCTDYRQIWQGGGGR